jgi:hypothetical protein
MAEEVKLTAKEKAILLFNKIKEETYELDSFDGSERNGVAKKCALICCDEVLNVWVRTYNTLFEVMNMKSEDVKESATYKYWQEIKQEIEKI